MSELGDLIDSLPIDKNAKNDTTHIDLIQSILNQKEPFGKNRLNNQFLGDIQPQQFEKSNLKKYAKAFKEVAIIGLLVLLFTCPFIVNKITSHITISDNILWFARTLLIIFLFFIISTQLC